MLSVATNAGAASTAPVSAYAVGMGDLAWALLYPARMAALTQLYAGLSGEVAAAAAAASTEGGAE